MNKVIKNKAHDHAMLLKKYYSKKQKAEVYNVYSTIAPKGTAR